MTNRIELNNEDLNKVAGGDLQGTANTWHHGTYVCPYCHKTHEFVTQPINICGAIVEKFSACAKTTDVQLYNFDAFAVNGTVWVWVNNDKYELNCKFDYVVAGGTRHNLPL